MGGGQEAYADGLGTAEGRSHHPGICTYLLSAYHLGTFPYVLGLRNTHQVGGARMCNITSCHQALGSFHVISWPRLYSALEAGSQACHVPPLFSTGVSSGLPSRTMPPAWARGWREPSTLTCRLHGLLLREGAGGQQ